MFIDFGRTPKWNCPLPEEQGAGGGLVSGPATPPPAPPTNNAWYIPPVPCYEPADGVFYAQIGPSGGQSGYNAITGEAPTGWGEGGGGGAPFWIGSGGWILKLVRLFSFYILFCVSSFPFCFINHVWSYFDYWFLFIGMILIIANDIKICNWLEW